MSVEQPALPRWEMTSLFPGPDSPEFQAAFAAVTSSLAAVETLLEDEGASCEPVSDGAVFSVEQVIRAYSDLNQAASEVEMYLVCLVAADATDMIAQSALSTLRQDMVRLQVLATRFAVWTASLSLDVLIGRSDLIREHAFALRHAQRAAGFQMSPGEEALAAELAPSGATAWSRLRQDIEAQLTIRLTIDGEEQTLPISESLNLAMHPDRAVRKAAVEAAAAAWRSVEVPVTAALNGVKGRRLCSPAGEAGKTHSRRRSIVITSTRRSSSPCWGRSGLPCPIITDICG